MKRFSLAVAVLAIGCATAWADGPKGTATIKGKVSAPEGMKAARPINMGADKYCATAHPTPVAPQGELVFDDGTLPYVFVYIDSGIEGKYDAPTAPITIDQNGCMYKPHVAGMIAGQPIQVKNSDDTNHNIHATGKKNPQFNFSQPKKGMTKDLTGGDTFTKPEQMVHVKCDVHPWMGAYIGVMSHPFFAVSGKGGTFEIKDVPAGKFTVAIWHEKYGKMTKEIEVKDGATVELDLKFEKKTGDVGHVRDVTLSMAE